MIARTLLNLIPDSSVVAAQWGLPFTIDEPDISLTDYGLALETATFSVILARHATRWPRLRRWCVAFFGATTVASVAGGTDHGFLRRDGRELGHDALWTTTLLAIGASSLALVGTGAELGLSRSVAFRLVAATGVALAAYTLVVLVAWRDYLVAILAYAPAALFLLGILVWRYLRLQDRESLYGIAAVLLAFIAAVVQQREIGIHPRYLGHNAFYHLIQAVSFALLFAAIRDLIEEPAPYRAADPQTPSYGSGQ